MPCFNPRAFSPLVKAPACIRRRFGVTVLLIKRRSGGDEHIADQLPDAEYVFREGDVMLVMGSEERLQRLERAG